MTLLEILQAGPVIPVIVIERAEDAVPLAKALVAGGVRVLEVTMRTDAALPAVKAIATEVPDAIVGVGTLTRAEQFGTARAAGATFAVSPGFTAELATAAKQSGLPLLPGVMTPSEVIAARAAGFSLMKLFPAQQAGGKEMLKAMSGPFPDIRFCPTGGIGRDDVREYLKLPNVVCVGGSWLTPATALNSKNWPEITRLARTASSMRDQ